MIRSQNLDDQTYESIVESAVNRIPYLYPEWTDYNPHDPGITLIELFAWYKEMQQYHMNVVTREVKLKLLKLAGMSPAPVRPAGYLVEFEPGSGSFPELSRMEDQSGVVFELEEAAHVPMLRIGRVYMDVNGIRDISDIAVSDKAVLTAPFNGDMTLMIGMDTDEIAPFRLWFDIAAGDPPRNPFTSPDQLPRKLRFELSGIGQVQPVLDETHGLTVSGFIGFDPNESWAVSDLGLDIEPLRYISVSVEEEGCEGALAVERIAANVFRARQRETLARTSWHTVEAKDNVRIRLADAVSLQGSLLAYVRGVHGLEQVKVRLTRQDNVMNVDIDAGEACGDGQPNLLILSIDPVRGPMMLWDSTGLPGQRFDISSSDNYRVVSGGQLLCDTLCGDGKVRPALWRCTEDLLSAGPRDRVFQTDVGMGTVSMLFGDGEHGGVVPQGKAAILIADGALTLASGGNVPDGKDMPLLDADARVSYRREYPGREAQNVEEAADELIKRLAAPCRCVSCEDYESIAMQTPGIRILAARAIPMFDPDAPVSGSSAPVMTLVVIPAGEGRPMPNQWFLSAVKKHVDRRRTICTRLKVVAPLYVGVHVAVRLMSNDDGIEDRVREALMPFFNIQDAGELVGKPLLRSEVVMAVGGLSQVLRLADVRLTPAAATCYADRNGDLIIPKHGMPYIASLTVERI